MNNKTKMKRLDKIGRRVFWLSISVTGLVMLKVLYDRMMLPAGVCPMNSNRPWLFLAIGLLILSLGVTIYNDYNKRKKGKKSEKKNG